MNWDLLSLLSILQSVPIGWCLRDTTKCQRIIRFPPRAGELRCISKHLDGLSSSSFIIQIETRAWRVTENKKIGRVFLCKEKKKRSVSRERAATGGNGGKCEREKKRESQRAWLELEFLFQNCRGVETKWRRKGGFVAASLLQYTPWRRFLFIYLARNFSLYKLDKIVLCTDTLLKFSYSDIYVVRGEYVTDLFTFNIKVDVYRRDFLRRIL